LALALGACQTLAPYGPASGLATQGWSQQPIESNRWRVSYRGHGRPEMVSDYALLRSAELTLEQGHDWFLVEQSWIDAGHPGGAAMGSDYARLASAELTLGQGHDWLRVEQRWIDAGHPGGARPSVSIGAGRSDYGRYSSSGVGVGLGLNLGGGEATVVSMEIR